MSASNESQNAVQVRIYGRVQGVWFRAWTMQTAAELGLAGWVRNRADGSVEALFVGPSVGVETMVGKCGDGPPAARVDRVNRETPPPGSFDEIRAAGFRQLPTA